MVASILKDGAKYRSSEFDIFYFASKQHRLYSLASSFRDHDSSSFDSRTYGINDCYGVYRGEMISRWLLGVNTFLRIRRHPLFPYVAALAGI